MSYNPMIDYKRNELMAQQAMIQQQLAQLNQMSQPQMMNPQNMQNQTQYFVREINSFDDAKRIVPNFGEVYVLIDSNNGKIYLKQMNVDSGKSDYLFYNIDETEKSEMKDPIALINERLTNIEKAIGGLRNESVPGNAAVSEICGKSDGDIDSEPVSENATAEPGEIPAGSEHAKRKESKRAS